MNQPRPFIGVDWGTSSMRAMLCAAERRVPDKGDMITGEGISKLKRPIADVLFEMVEPWEDRFGKLPIVMSGMVGSNIGWRTTPYVECPASLADLADHAVSFEHSGHHITILPGVRGLNTMGESDLMRGEELQLLGWLSRNPDADQCDRLFCLPGTHTKWARMEAGRLQSFTTALTGELFALLQNHSILLPRADVVFAQPFDEASFLAGVDLMARQPGGLLHALFSTRTRVLTLGEDAGDAPSYLSGLVIGSDVRAALDSKEGPGTIVEVIGASALAEKYELAIHRLGYDCNILDGVDAVYAGFMAL